MKRCPTDEKSDDDSGWNERKRKRRKKVKIKFKGKESFQVLLLRKKPSKGVNGKRVFASDN